jgi:hypothetical protein
MPKRYRLPKPKPGEFIVRWSRVPLESRAPEICYVWGDGVPNRDKHLFHIYFCMDRPKFGAACQVDPSFAKELELAGYDMDTLRFSIRKKVVDVVD